MNVIIWPKDYIPETSDNYVSNEIIVANLSTLDIWPFLNNPLVWPTYYHNVSEIRSYNRTGPQLFLGARFRFTTFGLPVEAEVTEYEPPVDENPARIAWHGWATIAPGSRLDVHHAWLLENLPQGRCRILTQATQNGKLARKLAQTKPNLMLNAHQEWLNGLASAAARRIESLTVERCDLYRSGISNQSTAPCCPESLRPIQSMLSAMEI